MSSNPDSNESVLPCEMHRHYKKPKYSHFLDLFASVTGLGSDLITPAMVEEVRVNPNCFDMEGEKSKLNLTSQQQEFIANNLNTLIPDLGTTFLQMRKRTSHLPKEDRFHATHLEIRAINGLAAAIEWKQINFKQIKDTEFLLRTLEPEIDKLFYALGKWHDLAMKYPRVDLFKLYLSIPHNNVWDYETQQWDAVELPHPLNRAMESLRGDYHCVPTAEEPTQQISRWKDAGEMCGSFQESAVKLIQMLWVGIHPFR